MKAVTTVVYKDLRDEKDWRYEERYNTADPAIAVRRFFAERGNKTWLVPTRVFTEEMI